MVQESSKETPVICVVGLGYVGLPLALAFGRTDTKTYGFDINTKRVSELEKGIDSSRELSVDEVRDSKLEYTSDESDIKRCDFVIVAVPTPVNKANQPDMSLVEKASVTVGHNLKKGAIVVYESTVYPGATEEVCIPILERESGLSCGRDFKVGYSPERINPGDREHTLEKIVKVVSGMDKESTKIVADTYRLVCLAGVHIAPNIKTAEAAKVIENTQRDLNIALMNELSLIFHRVGINTKDVLEAAGTKWNFLKYTPGLVGGHCIGVDPYYLVYKAEELGYHPQVIAAGRRVNDYMSEYVTDLTVQGLIEAGKPIQGSTALVMGLSFKEDVKDLRNSKIADTIKHLQKLGVLVTAHEPLLDCDEDYSFAENEFGLPILKTLEGKYDAIIIAQAHKAYKTSASDISKLFLAKPVIVDIKEAFSQYKNSKDLIYKSL